MDWNCRLPKFGRPSEMSNWLRQQLDWRHDSDFGVRFWEGMSLPGTSPADFQHRQLTVGEQTLLVGIRFKNRDRTRPFVDLLAWTGELKAEWMPAIAHEFARFRPLAVRYCLTPEDRPLAKAEVDQHLVAGLAAGAEHPRIVAARDLSWFDEYAASYETWRASTSLGDEVFAEDLETMQDCLDRGRIVVALQNDVFVGVAAARPQTVRSISGWTIVEEFVVPAARGHGLGADLQRSVMNLMPRGECVWGTIHGKNAPSLATARKCGREIVETWWMTPL